MNFGLFSSSLDGPNSRTFSSESSRWPADALPPAGSTLPSFSGSGANSGGRFGDRSADFSSSDFTSPSSPASPSGEFELLLAVIQTLNFFERQSIFSVPVANFIAGLRNFVPANLFQRVSVEDILMFAQSHRVISIAGQVVALTDTGRAFARKFASHTQSQGQGQASGGLNSSLSASAAEFTSSLPLSSSSSTSSFSDLSDSDLRSSLMPFGKSGQFSSSSSEVSSNWGDFSSRSGAISPVLSPPFQIPPITISFPPGSLEEKYFKNEQQRHLYYMFNFRVHACTPFHQKACPADKAKFLAGGSGTGGGSDCFDFHNPKMKRRIPRPVAYSNGIFWNYNACRCQAIEKEMRCEKGDSCRYSHCKEEIAYHPSRYKTQLCSYVAKSDGVCSRFGPHCAFSHGQDDLRKPIVLKQGMPHRLLEDPNAPMSNQSAFNSHGIVSQSATTNHSPDDSPRGGSDEVSHSGDSSKSSAPIPNRDEVICPIEFLLTDRRFYLHQYKVQPCHLNTPECLKGTCPNYHYDNKRRRDPQVHQYAHEPCPNVKSPDSGHWKRPSCCPLLDSCLLSHTLLESMYHPSVYKSVMCSNFNEHDPTTWNKCSWGRQCSHSHSRAELEFNEACIRFGEPPSSVPPSQLLQWARNALASASQPHSQASSAGSSNNASTASSRANSIVSANQNAPSSSANEAGDAKPSTESAVSAHHDSAANSSESDRTSSIPEFGEDRAFGGGGKGTYSSLFGSSAPSNPPTVTPGSAAAAAASILSTLSTSSQSSAAAHHAHSHHHGHHGHHSRSALSSYSASASTPQSLAEWGREKAEMAKKLLTQQTEIQQLKQYLKDEQAKSTALKSEVNNLRSQMLQLQEESASRARKQREMAIINDQTGMLDDLSLSVNSLRWEIGRLTEQKRNLERDVQLHAASQSPVQSQLTAADPMASVFNSDMKKNSSLAWPAIDSGKDSEDPLRGIFKREKSPLESAMLNARMDALGIGGLEKPINFGALNSNGHGAANGHDADFPDPASVLGSSDFN